jgi:hypothetical protein
MSRKSLKRWAFKGGQILADSIHQILIDLVFGKSKYRKKGAKMRPIIHRTINNERTIIVKSLK